MNKKMKKLLALGLGAVMALSMTACGGNDAEPAGDDLTPITFCLDWTPNTNHTGVYVAKQMGYYEEAGLDVTIVQPAESTAYAMTSAGEAQFAVGYQDTMASTLCNEDAANFTAIGAIVQHNTSGIMSRKGDGIESPKGLTGKRYSSWDMPTEIAMLKTVVNGDGGDFDKVELIPNNITDEPAALQAEQTDSIWVYEGWGKINADIEGVDVDYFNFREYDDTFDYYSPVVVANNDLLKDDPEIAEAFMAATAKGYEYAAANPAEAAQSLIDGDDTGSLANAEELVVKSQEFLSKEYIADAPQWGYIDEARWNKFYTWLYENELTEVDLTGKGFSNAYLPAQE